MPEYPPSGILWQNSKKTSPNSPSHTGNLEITQEVLEYLNGLFASGKPMKMELSAWEKNNGKGPFISMKASVPWQDRSNQQAYAPKAKAPARPPTTKYPTTSFDDDSDIPF